LTESDDVVLFDFPQVSVPQDLPPLPIVATIKEDNASYKFNDLIIIIIIIITLTETR
jgi:hypothetical protein